MKSATGKRQLEQPRLGSGASVLVACFLAAAIFGVACSSNSSSSSASPAGPATISYMTWGGADGPQKVFGLYQITFPSDSTGMSIDVKVGGTNDGEVVNQLRLMLTAHSTVPDIVQLNYSEVSEFATAGQLLDLKPYISANLSSMSPSALKLMQYNGKYVAVANEVKEKLWYYRKDMFAAAGIDPTEVKTQSDFIAAGKKLQLKYPKSYIWNLAASQQAYVLGEITSGNGARISDPSTHQFVVGSDVGIRNAFQAEAALRASGVVATKFDDFSPEWQAALADGTLASVPIAEWFSLFLPQYAPKLAGQWGVTTWPEIGGATDGAGSEAGGSVFVVPVGAKHAAQALKFLGDMYMTKTGNLAFWQKFGGVPSVTAAENDPTLAQDPYFGADLIKAYVAAAPTYKIFPYDPAAIKEITILQSALATFLGSGSSDPTSALQAAQQQMTAQIGDPYKQ